MKKYFPACWRRYFASPWRPAAARKRLPLTPPPTPKRCWIPGPLPTGWREIDRDIACTLYGIDETTVSDCAVYGSTGATAEELAIFTFSNHDDAGTALTALQNRVADRKEALASYQPDEVTKLEGAVTQARGNSVLLVIAADYTPVETFLKG